MTVGAIKAGRTGLLVGATAWALHAAPIVTVNFGLRTRFLPTLAGLGNRRDVALTFDDGPDPTSTPLVLDAPIVLDGGPRSSCSAP